jgi:6-phosphogluconolactonase
MAGKYVAYVGTYTYERSAGIRIYDVDMERGVFKLRSIESVHNSSYVIVSHNKKYLYSIIDEGVAAFRIEKNGNLRFINSEPIGGMRGCFLSLTKDDRFLFVAGYHDGRVTVMRLYDDGSILGITAGVFHRGMGKVITDRNARPRVNCVMPTPDEKYICAVDNGLDHIKIYAFERRTGKIKLADILRLEMGSAPRHLRFSKDGRFAYLICELSNQIHVYTYDGESDKEAPVFQRIQSISTKDEAEKRNSAAYDMKISEDGKYLFCSNAGINTATIFSIDPKTGLLTYEMTGPVSGDYPKAVGVFADGQHFVSLNHDGDSLSFFHVDYKNGYFLNSAKPIDIEKPNCIEFYEVQE